MENKVSNAQDLPHTDSQNAKSQADERTQDMENAGGIAQKNTEDSTQNFATSHTNNSSKQTMDFGVSAQTQATQETNTQTAQDIRDSQVSKVMQETNTQDSQSTQNSQDIRVAQGISKQTTQDSQTPQTWDANRNDSKDSQDSKAAQETNTKPTQDIKDSQVSKVMQETNTQDSQGTQTTNRSNSQTLDNPQTTGTQNSQDIRVAQGISKQTTQDSQTPQAWDANRNDSKDSQDSKTMKTQGINTNNSQDSKAAQETNTQTAQDIKDSKDSQTIQTPQQSMQNALPQERYLKVLLGVGLALLIGGLTFCFAFYYLHASLKVSGLIGIIGLLVTLWTNKALPMGVVSLLPIILFPSFGILDTKSATANYANPIIYLFLGGFMIATATEKIGLHRVIAKFFLARFPKTIKGVISALGVASVMLGTALSNSTVALLLLPVAMSITDDKVLRTRFLLAVAFGASISGITTPIGSPPNLIYLGFLESQGLQGISFTTWIFMMAPLTCLMLFMMIKILSFGVGEQPLNLSLFDSIQVNATHKRLLCFIVALLVILLINSPIRPFYNGLGWNENVILLAFGLMMFLPKIGFLDWDDTKSIPYEIIFLFGAGFCIATAFSQAELGGAFTSFFAMFEGLPFVVFLFLACCFAIIATGFLSTTALIAILLPVIEVATQPFLSDTSRVLLMLVVTICASFSFMIPISTPPNAIVFAQGGIRAWDMIRFGFLLSLVGILCVTLFSAWYWWSFLETNPLG